MASAFSFGFAGDDIDMDDSDFNGVDQSAENLAQDDSNALPELLEAKKHDMKDWIPTLPSQISYNKLNINVSPDQPSGKTLTLARREVFDIRAQLMAEDTVDHENEELIAGLEKGDIKPHFYEGGFKTWECALDLAKLVVNEDRQVGDDGNSEGDRHIIELGAGTAVPSLALFAQLLSSEPSTANSQRKTHFTFADYNSAVLRLVTFPNLLLTWNHVVTHQNSASDVVSAEEGQAEEEELDITPELVEGFERDLASRGIVVEFISGAWSPAFVDLVLSSAKKSKSRTLVLASETIYSPSSLGAFSETLLALLRPTEGRGPSKALVAAKKVYFGVGGGVDEFLAVFRGIAGEDMEVKEELNIKSEGVGRVVLDITARGSQ